MSFFKNFVLMEDVRIQFRAEVFNALNTVNLANPNTCVDCPGTAGRITNIFQLATMRQWQFGLRVEFCERVSKAANSARRGCSTTAAAVRTAPFRWARSSARSIAAPATAA